ncbi:hypothetical protein EJ04DRAFT_520770 [Polyplosphaeria fusca]|uniref:Uncharacterized protein n=1 Tax=Polyplosphaeria fusca TaxID=682080 RepID=A0A9P4V309_9PLEO|nr:hypothetical protein EJ04DRAFT_520770 [Polyplosphaeria fusca]
MDFPKSSLEPATDRIERSSIPAESDDINSHAANTPRFSSLDVFAVLISSLVYIPCVIMIASLAIGPLTQQSSGTQPCVQTIKGARASIPYSLMALPHFRKSAGLWVLEPGISAKISNACSAAPRNTTLLTQGCTTGNCSFPVTPQGHPLSTRGTCSKCVDTTRSITKVIKDSSASVMLPNGQIVGPHTGTLPIGTVALGTDAGIKYASSILDDDFIAAINISSLQSSVMGMTVEGCELSDDAPKSCTRPSSLNFTFDGLP